MAERHIFIGLGGTGVNTVSIIKYKVYERIKATEMKTRLQVMNETYRFLFVDTDSRDVADANDKYRNLYEDGKVDFISEGENLVNLGDINPYTSYHEAAADLTQRVNRRIVEACPPDVAETMENRDLSFGAGAFRLKSRIAFGRKEGDFIGKLLTAINELNTIENDNEKNVIHYWVVASSNGGTGSGILPDVLYLVNMLHRTHVDPGNPKVGLVLWMPRIFMNLNADNEKYPRNAYAVFQEIEAFQKWTKESPKNLLYHRMAMTDDFTLFDEKMAYRPFEFCIPIDFHTEKNSNLGDISKMYSNTAELMFYIHSGEGASGFKSFLDNNEDGDVPNGPEFFLIPLGYMALRKPDEQFENYMALRVKYEMLRYGILGSPVESDDKRKELMMTLFQTVIKNVLFDNKSKEDSYFSIIRNGAQGILEDDMPDNLILDNDNKVVKKLPVNVTIEEARSVIGRVEQLISRHSEEKKKTRDAIKTALWEWTEENARKWGLQYVLGILNELDAYCTDLDLAYNTDTNVRILDQLGKSRKSLVENCDSIEGELDDLYWKAQEITMKERLLNNNSDDVQNFFSRLKDWVKASVAVTLSDEAFGMIHELAYGDRGIIDYIISHLCSMVAAATSVLNDEKGAAKAYMGLAKHFYLTKLDVTSVYLPDISEFANGNGWVEDNNKFSEWYSMIIGRSTVFVPGEGYAPLRNNDTVVSLEALFSQMVNQHNESMVQEKYFVDGKSRLFTNTDKSDYKRVIEDLLDYTADTMKALLRKNITIGGQWYNKTLATFFSELNSEASKDIKNKTQPTLFFPYNKSKRISRITEKSFCVGPRGVVENVFLEASSAGKTQLLDHADPSVMYKIKTLLGMSFNYYDMYQNIKNQYDCYERKVFCHFHQAFATSGGNADGIKLPREIKPEMVVFAKYLVLDQLSGVFSDIMRKGTERYNVGHYSDTPLISDDKIAKFATAEALRMIDNEMVELRITDGTSQYYQTVTIDHTENKRTEQYGGFCQHYANGRFAALATNLVKNIEFLEQDLLYREYKTAVDTLKSLLNEEWERAGRNEKDTIGDILRVLNERLDTVDKFTNGKYQG